MTPAQFATAVGCLPERAEVWFEPFKAAMALWAVDTPARQAALLAQVGHESGGLTRIVEDLNYGAQAMMKAWPKRFPTIESARYYEHNPERLANFVYANRMGNGDYQSGDGWRYRGRGPIQITGRENYERHGRAIGIDLVADPDQLLQPTAGALASCSFFVAIGGNELAAAGEFDEISRRVNGAATIERVNGLEERRARLRTAVYVLTKGTA